MAHPRTDDIEQRMMANLANGQPHGLSDQDIQEVFNALRTYQRMASYFADIIAATAADALAKKSTSKSERARQAGIVLQVHSDLKHEACSASVRRDRDAVVARLRTIIDTAGRAAPEPGPMTYRCAQCGQKHVIGINHAAAVRLGQVKS